MVRGKFIVGSNYKMNGSQSSLLALVGLLNHAQLDSNVEIFISPPLVYIDLVRKNLRRDVAVGAQNCYLKATGAYTGEVAPEMLRDIGAEYVILGHTERREIFKESDTDVGLKVEQALQAGLRVIACVGEKLEEHQAEKTLEVLYRQLDAIADHVLDWSNLVVAYEPVWAIGTGRVATPEQAQRVHRAIREWLRSKKGDHVADQTRIIYGGSVNLSNAAMLANEEDIDGLFVGGASLKPEFVDICNVLQGSR